MMNVRFLGTTDEVTTCDCCGRTGLKSTVAVSIDDGDALFYGVTCAARALSVGVKDVRSASKLADEEKAAAEAAARAAKFAAETAPWFAFLAAHGKGLDNFARIESLGGYKAARAAYEAAR